MTNCSPNNTTTERPTNADALGSPDPTWPPMSSNRHEGILWSERLFSQYRTSELDAVRFALGIPE